jgi:energy-coupling factor transporter transmembrane protein EcfT
VQIHPAFFWIWATLIATSAIRLDESAISLFAILAILILVRFFPKEILRMNTFRLALRLAIIAIAIRLTFAVLIGVPMPGETLFTIPSIQLPDFLVGIRLGGEVTTQRLSGAFGEALLFATIILLYGAANSLTAPTKILRIIPHRLYGVGLATALATKLTPQFADSVMRIRQAQHLRGQSSRGFKSWIRMGAPVLEETMSRSLDLAAALEARGYGTRGRATRYRPLSWGRTESIALLPALYAATFLPSLSLTLPLTALIFCACVLSPAVLR